MNATVPFVKMNGTHNEFVVVDARETPLDEFVKAGGSAKCLTLRLDGEEAAAWKHVPLPCPEGQA